MRTRAGVIGVALVALAGCSGEIDPAGPTDITSGQFSLQAQQAAHDTIMVARPRATQLMVEQVNLTLAKNNILGTVVKDVEQRILSPLTDGQPPTTCPYLTKVEQTGAVSCRFLVDTALTDALVSSGTLRDSIEQDVEQQQGTVLRTAELQYVKAWAGEAVLSGIDVGAVHAADILREQGVCDQAPTPSESAFDLGEQQGKALLEATATNMLETFPHTECNTDIIAYDILTAASDRKDAFVADNPLCAGYAPSELAAQVDLSQAERNRFEGLDEGLRQGYEALRVRLVNTWECTKCSCYPVQQWQLDAHGCSNVQAQGGQVCFNDEDVGSNPPHSADDVCNLAASGVEQVPPDMCTMAPPLGDPLVVDLEGRGPRFDRARASFDLAATGEPAEMPVLGAGNALLALDRDGNGRIDSGAELLSNAAPCGERRCRDGIESLAALDWTRDGAIDARDPAFRSLRLWIDTDGDGDSSPAELLSLEEAGITSIALQPSRARPYRDTAGNRSMRSLAFTRADGSGGVVYDVWYALHFEQAPSDPRSSGIVSTLPERR